MKKQIKLIVAMILALIMAFSFTACGKNKSKTFEEACEDLKQEIISTSSYRCEFEHEEIYGRPVYLISVYVSNSATEYASLLASVSYNSFKDKFLPYIEENFSNFTTESIFVIVFLNNKNYEGSSGYIYGYYANKE